MILRYQGVGKTVIFEWARVHQFLLKFIWRHLWMVLRYVEPLQSISLTDQCPVSDYSVWTITNYFGLTFEFGKLNFGIRLFRKPITRPDYLHLNTYFVLYILVDKRTSLVIGFKFFVTRLFYRSIWVWGVTQQKTSWGVFYFENKDFKLYYHQHI